MEPEDWEALLETVDRVRREGHAATVHRVAVSFNQRVNEGQIDDAGVEALLEQLVAEHRVERRAVDPSFQGARSDAPAPSVQYRRV